MTRVFPGIESQYGEREVGKRYGERRREKTDEKADLTEPSTVGLHTPRLRLVLALLERSSLYDLAVPVVHRFAAVEHLQARRRLRIAVKVFALDSFDCAETC